MSLSRKKRRWVCNNWQHTREPWATCARAQITASHPPQWIDANFVCPHFKQLLMRVRRHSLRTRAATLFWEVVDIWRYALSHAHLHLAAVCIYSFYAPLFVQLLRARCSAKNANLQRAAASRDSGEITARKHCAHKTICLTPPGQVIRTKLAFSIWRNLMDTIVWSGNANSALGNAPTRIQTAPCFVKSTQ